MPDNGEIRYCNRFSYILLKFILFAYAIIWWLGLRELLHWDKNINTCRHDGDVKLQPVCLRRSVEFGEALSRQVFEATCGVLPSAGCASDLRLATPSPVHLYPTVTCLIRAAIPNLLDLTAVFDTINHTILLSRLKYCFNITSSVLSWLKPYFANRLQFISINNCTSFTAPLSQGVPQGSVLGPLLFNLYILPFGNIIYQHGLYFDCYADDVQLYISTKSITTDIHTTLTKLK
ncbi:hypothetical protein L3Q82_000292 [Scortum barcoo]|uniref:Uncharacterized protein n=1 Tax=Scortum barcoo TaxID=214431 RepID=A0ACB8XC23_9TELE|nr:hypothetical protein L3Q82_000292 [Scortum barcoo]